MDRKRSPLPILLVAAAAILLGAHLWVSRPGLDQVLPASIHEFTMELGFEGFGGAVRLPAFLPVSHSGETVLTEPHEQGPLAFSDQVTPAGRLGEWTGRPPDGQHTVTYTARVATRELRYELPSGLGFGGPLSDSLRRHLEQTD